MMKNESTNLGSALRVICIRWGLRVVLCSPCEAKSRRGAEQHCIALCGALLYLGMCQVCGASMSLEKKNKKNNTAIK